MMIYKDYFEAHEEEWLAMCECLEEMAREEEILAPPSEEEMAEMAAYYGEC